MKTSKILFIVSLIGVIILLILVKNLNPPMLEQNLTALDLGKTYSIEGKIQKITLSSKVTSITIKNKNYSEIEILAFTDQINLTKNQDIMVKGRLDSYNKNKTTIIANKIELLQ